MPGDKKEEKQNRCYHCNKLLGVGDPGNIVIKCPRCSRLNRFTLVTYVKRQDLKTKHVDLI